MPILYYPNGTAKKFRHHIEQAMLDATRYSYEGSNNITATGADATLWVPTHQWEVQSVSLRFSAADAKNYAVEIAKGRGIVATKNDRVYFSANGCIPEAIVLDQGFYTGTELAAHLKTKLDANTTFVANGTAPFTVAYSAGLFTITAAAGTVKYIDVNTIQRVRRESTAGMSLGFTVDSTTAISISSDTAVFGLDSTVGVGMTATGSTAQSIYSNEKWPMDVDTAISITTSTAPVTVDYAVVYKILI